MKNIVDEFIHYFVVGVIWGIAFVAGAAMIYGVWEWLSP